jgi:hypothetical protein
VFRQLIEENEQKLAIRDNSWNEQHKPPISLNTICLKRRFLFGFP